LPSRHWPRFVWWISVGNLPDYCRNGEFFTREKERKGEIRSEMNSDCGGDGTVWEEEVTFVFYLLSKDEEKRERKNKN